MHLSLLIVAFIILQISQVSRTPKYQKITIRSVSMGNGAKEGNLGATSRKDPSESPKKEVTTPNPPKNTPPKVEKPVQQSATANKEAKAPPKKVSKEKVKSPKQERKTAKTLKKEVGQEETSRNSKNASLVEEALSSITQEIETINRNNAVSKAIAKLEGGGTQNTGVMDYGTYIDIVGTILKNQWFYPNLGTNDKLRTTIRIFVDGSGKILNYRIERSSGREDFDASALRSIEQYTHFPVPPNRKSVDFVVNFNLLEE